MLRFPLLNATRTTARLPTARDTRPHRTGALVALRRASVHANHKIFAFERMRFETPPISDARISMVVRDRHRGRPLLVRHRSRCARVAAARLVLRSRRTALDELWCQLAADVAVLDGRP